MELAGGGFLRTKNVILNVFFSFGKQIVLAISGLILPRLLMGKFGSEVNGLIGSLTQFLSYIMLMEAGIGGVISASLYKPLYEKDMVKVSGIIEAAKQFYKKIGYISILYILVLCIIYPRLIHSSFSNAYIVSMILILAMGILFQYFVSLPYMSLVKASQKMWVISNATILSTILNLIIVVILIKLNMSIQVVKGCSSVINLIVPLSIIWYVNKNYDLRKTKPDKNALKQRWNGLGHHLAFFIHTNTDIAVITLFMDLEYVSVYMVYKSVLTAVQSLVLPISESCSAAFGDLLAEGDQNKTSYNFDRFEFIQSSITTILYTITIILIIPFVKIYTLGINDANYIQPTFSIIIIIAEVVYCIRLIYSTVLLSANLYKETQLHAWLEAIINIVLSVLLVNSYGLSGIAVGTLCAMIVRGILDCRYLSKKLIKRSVFKSLKIIAINLFVSCLSIFIVNKIAFSPDNWISLIFMAIITSIIVGGVALILYIVLCRKYLKDIIKIIKK